MGFKCAPQVLGLVRNEPKKGQRHRANGKAILSEAGKERYSASETLDRDLSHLNRYTGFDSGFAAWNAMCKRADAYVTTGKTKDGKPYERSLRKDAVVGFALIINPPAEVCINWSDEDYDAFYQDTWDCMRELEPRIFSEKNIVMTAEHWDEGIPIKALNKDRHLHILGDSVDEHGHYCGNIIDAKLCITINQRYPEMMRQRGWDMEDLDTTDWERYQRDEEYRAERKAKSRKSGKSVNEHIKADIAKKTKKLQELAAEIRILEARNDALKQENITAVIELKNKLKQREADLRRRENEYHELIILGRRAKAEQLSGVLEKMKIDSNSENRRLPEFNY